LIDVGTRLEAAHPVRFLAARREQDDGQRLRRSRPAQVPAQLDAREPGQRPIQQQQVGDSLFQPRLRQSAVGDGLEGISGSLEIVAQKLEQRLFIFDHQDVRCHRPLCEKVRCQCSTERTTIP
jgi:hypothetical protein